MLCDLGRMMGSGVMSSREYPFTGQKGKCKFDKTKAIVSAPSWYTVTNRDENTLLDAVANTGPVAVAIDASHKSFQQYSSGIYYEPKCSQTQLNHFVLVVGYGTENGKDYWLIKNSWGTKWGIKGYMKMRRNANNQCGIASWGMYPSVL